MLANGIRDEGVKVYANMNSGRSWSGRAGSRQITLNIGSNLTYPYTIIDRYMGRQKRLADLLANPHIAKSPQELLGFIFIHELHHVRQFRKGAKKSEGKCTRWAYDHWKPMPPEMLEDGKRKAQDSAAKAEVRKASVDARETTKNSPAYKLAALEARLKKLDTRMKRMATSRKKLVRRLAYQQRVVAPKALIRTPSTEGGEHK
jgi:hypothetical protein